MSLLRRQRRRDFRSFSKANSSVVSGGPLVRVTFPVLGVRHSIAATGRISILLTRLLCQVADNRNFYQREAPGVRLG